MRLEAKRILNITKEGGNGLYLGLSEEFCRSKIQQLSYLKERFQQKVDSWENRFLSFSGRDVLLRSVAMTLPTYTMSCFLLHVTICKQLTSIVSNYWWKTNAQSKCIHWKKWEYMCLPKSEEGIGFRDIKSFNFAMLGKQGWRLATNSTSLFSRVFKARYYNSSSFLEAKQGTRPSLAWRSIIASQTLLRQGLRKTIGSGHHTSIWYENWLPTTPPRAPYPLVVPNSAITKVSDLLFHHNRHWTEEILNTTFNKILSSSIN